MTKIFVLTAMAAALVVGTTTVPSAQSSWNPKAAAAYLDGRAEWWSTWPNAKRDHDTVCVSCHMTAPYALARPSLRRSLGESAPAAPERTMAANVMKRIAIWRDTAPFYADQTSGLPKTSESRGTESVLNALVLAIRDGESGAFSDDLRAAFDNMWALQMKRQALAGAWAWLNFHYEPWESDNAPYFGATLAAMAIGAAPGSYAASAPIQDNVKLLREYLRKEFDRQPLFNQLMAQTASAKLPDIISDIQRQATVAAAMAKQQPDGGWTMAALGAWKRVDDTPLVTASDGYATGLVTLALQQAGISASNPALSKGLDWLRTHQDRAAGQWHATSLNKQRDPASDIGRFMDDAATAYAVMSLTYASPGRSTAAR
jgi:squalene-hopene/tetraprenyl-beta-curcumene cyclase